MTIRRYGLAGLAALTLACAEPRDARADEPTPANIERDFRELPMSARRLLGPLFWLHGDESAEQLVNELERVAEGGNGTFTAESRPHADWLGPGWYRDLAVCLDAAKRLDLTMWIFDEKWWPSGEVGGKVPPRYGSKYIEASVAKAAGGTKYEAAVSTDRLVALIAGRSTPQGIDGASLVDLTPEVRDGRISRSFPAGEWSVVTFQWKPSDGRAGRLLVDGASQDAVDWYIRTVYKPHHDHFGADFGKTIAGFFYDEPETPGDWGTEVLPELKARGLDWKKALVAHKLRLADPAEQTAYAVQYRIAFAEAWGKTLYGGITRWCHEHGVRSFGHWLEHSKEYLHDRECAGDMVQVQKYSDMGAIDAVFKQFVPGLKDDTYVTPKLGSSISHAYGKADDLAMVEIFGARGQDLSYPEMKWWTDLMHVAGINFHIPHSFNPRAPFDTDCPPYFFNGGFEPRYALYRVYADYTSRLSLMLSGGRHVCPVAFLYAGQSYHFPPAIPPEVMTIALQDALYDCDWIPTEVLERDMKIDGRTLALRGERYRVLVVPAVDVLPYESLARARQFLEAGGVVVGYGNLPTRSATPGHGPDQMKALRQAIWGERTNPGLDVRKTNPAGGRSYFLPATPTPELLQAVLAGDANVHPTLEVVSGETNHWLHVLHRVKSGRDVFLVANQNHEGAARKFRLRVTAAGVPECWDAMRNEITSIPFTRAGDAVELDLTLEPLESVLLVFAPEGRRLPPRIDGRERPVQGPIAVERLAVSIPQRVPPRARPSELEGLSWYWYPDPGDPAVAAPPGRRSFRKALDLPAGAAPARATFHLSADNAFVLHVNGQKAGESGMGEGDWTRPSRIDVTARLRAGANVLAIVATNGSNHPNPAGLSGKLVVEYDGRAPTTVPVDESWRTSKDEPTGWTAEGFDASSWPPARRVAPFGGGPWKTAGGELTLSPVRADPFIGRVTIPAGLDPKRVRLVLEVDGLAPEEAARVTVNGRYAGGFIGRPLRLDLSSSLKPGENGLHIEPFAPREARVVVSPR